jgi:hypothetical protein
MPRFRILSRIDAYVDYVAEVEADNAEEAVDLAYERLVEIAWEKEGVVEFDARRVVALNDDGEEIEDYVRGKG